MKMDSNKIRINAEAIVKDYLVLYNLYYDHV
jgi:hypothetical protein